MAISSDNKDRMRILAMHGQWDLVSQGLAKYLEEHPDDLWRR
jgi:hypothetical protein